MAPALLAWVAGVAQQLQQPEPWSTTVYGLFLAAALVLIAPTAIKNIAFWQRVLSITLAFALLGFASTGLRATIFNHHALISALEGKDISVTGLVAAMPQYSEAGTRFRFEVESAQLDGQPVHLPPRLHLGWYGGVWGGGELLTDLQRAPQLLQAGERWQMTVRLKAPHGGSNPHGFDFELWLWEQGLQATGYVRAGPRDTAPQRLTPTWWHPVERLRQQVRDAIFERLLTSGGDERDRVRLAGVVAALVVGDQQAIDRSDWDVFRATGVAHLMSIS
ncbi:MAG: ComEC/Rec2 family competence protein, partial [Burkholderiales bacterium]|nr:ComEC/Rec2 family competence protein [Burkholderiales bacterium]